MATKTIEKKSYQLIRDLDSEKDKCPPQAKVILDTLKAAPEQTMERVALIEALKDGRLKATQPEERVFGFYRPKLIAAKLIKEIIFKVEIEVPDKEPKEPKKKNALTPEGEAATTEAGAEATAENGEAKSSKVKGSKGTPKESAPPPAEAAEPAQPAA